MCRVCFGAAFLFSERTLAGMVNQSGMDLIGLACLPLAVQLNLWPLLRAIRCGEMHAAHVQMDDGSIAEVLERKLRVKAGSLLFVQTTVPTKKMPRLCSKFRCFTRDSVWKDRSDEVRSHNSMLAANHSSEMHGVRQSSSSQMSGKPLMMCMACA